jgi:hypothetical protein
MKLLFSINGHNLLLTSTQAEIIAETLHGCEMIEHKYMGSKLPKGQEYVDLIRPSNPREYLKVGMLSNMDYDAMVFVTNQLDGA